MIRNVMSLLVLAATARADVPPDYGFQWATIGDPGNRPTNLEEVPYFEFSSPEQQHSGDVAYEFRMAKTEVTVGQWFEFVQAYAPYYQGTPGSQDFTGRGVRWSAVGGYFINRNPQTPTDMGWEYAARYCNWLHNGMALTRDAFETGAYDIGLMTHNPDGTYNHQSHLPDAKFWIPTASEWTKGMYWDPNKDAVGGYWRYPNSSDVPPIGGLPGSGGETNNGAPTQIGMPVGSYPSTHSPWGLLDGSGGVSEMTETFAGVGSDVVITRGSFQFVDATPLFDRIDFWGTSFLRGQPSIGLRLASAVPAPNVIALFGLAVLPRRRRCGCRSLKK